MVPLNGRNLTLTPEIARQVAALPALHPARRHSRNANAQAGSSRNQVCLNIYFPLKSLNILKRKFHLHLLMLLQALHEIR
jgi:hypothetical protein